MNNQPQPTHEPSRRLTAALALALVALPLVAFWSVSTFEFVNLDDGLYVYANPHIQEGLTWQSLRWAFSTLDASFYYPLTWLSYLLDHELFGMNPRGYHLTNLILHAANTLLLFAALRALLKAGKSPETTPPSQADSSGLLKCAFTAALFAIHPLHVEPVAWVSARKDLLSASFLFLTLIAYARYVARPAPPNEFDGAALKPHCAGRSIVLYLPIALFLTFGLMSKSMLVTTPILLLLLDGWPLKRFTSSSTQPKRRMRRAAYLVLEKVPLLTVVLAFGVLSVLGQRRESALSSLEGLPLAMRLTNAIYSYAVYLLKTLWPTRLAAFYPHPRDTLAPWQIACASVFLFAMTAFALRQGRRRPYIAVGWFWYVVSLIPVCGILQVGTHGMADRYTYVPLIGVFIGLTWGVAELASRWKRASTLLPLAGAAVLAAFLAVTAVQVRHWRNTETLFRHACRVTRNNVLAHRTLGHDLLAQGRPVEAEAELRRVAQLLPADPEAQFDWGVACLQSGQLSLAQEAFETAIQHTPSDARLLNALGVALLRQGQYEEARGRFAQAAHLRADLVDARTNLGAALLALGRTLEASAELSKAIERSPQDPDIHTNLAIALIDLGRRDEARAHLQEALRLVPNHLEARRTLERLNRSQ